jgi:hypothetical protein
MFEELLEFVLGPVGIVAALTLGTKPGRQLLRDVTKQAIKAGMVFSEQAQEVAAELKETTEDIVAELKSERNGETHAPAAKTKSSKSA